MSKVSQAFAYRVIGAVYVSSVRRFKSADRVEPAMTDRAQGGETPPNDVKQA
jgi:hypothetical protein